MKGWDAGFEIFKGRLPVSEPKVKTQVVQAIDERSQYVIL